MQDRVQITNEILEHTKDCDYNRSQHFIEFEHYDRISRILNLIQIWDLVFLVAFCSIFIPEVEFESETLKYSIPIILSLIATTAQLIDYFCNFSDLARQHWLAAQAYARLYRQCQFFPSHYGASCDEHIMREAASNICNELFDLNLMSPDLSKRSYKKVSYLQSKKYPIESDFYNHRINQLLPIVETIKVEFDKYEIEIFSFGSYTKSLHNNDIDIALIVHSDAIDESELSKKVIRLEQQFRKNNFKIDLTLLTKNRLNIQSQIAFINSIKKGERIYASPELHSSIFDYTFNNAEFEEMVNANYQQVIDAFETTDINNIINKAYYYVRNVIIYILMNKKCDWSSEDEMIEIFNSKINETSYYADIEHLYFVLKKMRDNEISVGIDQVFSEREKNSVFNIITDIHSKMFISK